MSRTMLLCPVSSYVEAYICLGSNCTDSQTVLDLARKELSNLSGSRLVNCSSIYYTEPQDYTKQPWFSNQVIKIMLERSAKSQWHPKDLLVSMLDIESRLGRVRDPSLRFGPRKIDLDLLLFGQTVMNDPDCTLPHPRMSQRAFVLVPLTELNPEILFAGETAIQCLQNLDYCLEGKKIFQKSS